MLGNRPLGVIARNALRPSNYRALVNMPRRYVDLRTAASRYFRRTGDYPYECAVRTPAGVVRPVLWSWHDMLTVNEVFCREDYAIDRRARVVVDIGSNIGLSALYFLTESPDVHCYLYEPVPANVERLRENLRSLANRWDVEQVAVADSAGTTSFGVEASGRYGGLDRSGGERIDVRVRHVNDVLGEVLERNGFVDVLKLDTEGAEERTVAAIDPDLLARVGTVYLETDGAGVSLPGFESRLRCETLRLRNRTPRRSS